MRSEYKVKVLKGDINPGCETDLENILNEEGTDGWELVNIIPQIGSSYTETIGNEVSVQYVSKEVETNFNILIFKKSV